jgi:excisionase family DNA binding protein
MTDLTVQEAADRLRISRRTMMSLIAAGEFPHAYKAGKFWNSGWRIPEHDLTAFTARTRQASQEPSR